MKNLKLMISKWKQQHKLLMIWKTSQRIKSREKQKHQIKTSYLNHDLSAPTKFPLHQKSALQQRKSYAKCIQQSCEYHIIITLTYFQNKYSPCKFWPFKRELTKNYIPSGDQRLIWRWWNRYRQDLEVDDVYENLIL